MAVFELFVDDYLFLEQVIVTNPKILSVSHTLSLSEDTSHNNRTRKVSHFVNFQQNYAYHFGIFNAEISDHLGIFQNLIPRTYYAEVFDFFFPYHNISGYVARDSSGFLNLSHSIDVYKSTPTSSIFALVHEIGLQVIRNIVVNQQFVLSSKQTGYRYTDKFIATEPLVNPVNSAVTFTFGSFNLSIRAPDFGNTLNLEFSRVTQKTRGNDSILARTSTWPKTKLMNLTFSCLKESEKDRFKELLRISLGRFLTYTDHFGRNWNVLIKTPGAVFQQESRNTFGVTIEMQGERL